MLREKADRPAFEVSEDIEASDAAESRLFANAEDGRGEGEGEGEGEVNLNAGDGEGFEGACNSYVSSDHRARVLRKTSKSWRRERRSFQAVTRCPSHVSRRPSRSSNSERSLRR